MGFTELWSTGSELLLLLQAARLRSPVAKMRLSKALLNILP